MGVNKSQGRCALVGREGTGSDVGPTRGWEGTSSSTGVNPEPYKRKGRRGNQGHTICGPHTLTCGCFNRKTKPSGVLLWLPGT